MATTDQIIEQLVRFEFSNEPCTIDQYRQSLIALVALAKAEVQQEYMEIDGESARRKFCRTIH